MRLFVLAALALLVSFNVPAATVVKCMDSSGKVTFVQNQCPEGLVGELRDVKASQRPSGDGPAVRMADPSKTYVTAKPKPVRKVRTVQPQQVEADAAPVAAAPTRVIVQQPCKRYVEQRIRYTRKATNGGTTGGVRVVKVPVPC